METESFTAKFRILKGPIKTLTWSSSTGSPETGAGLGAVKNREQGRKVTCLPFLKITLGESPKMAAPGRETWPANKGSGILN